MQRAVSVFVVSLLLGGAWPCPASASSFTFTTIDVGLTRGINDAGEIVGEFGLLSEGNLTSIRVPGSFFTEPFGTWHMIRDFASVEHSIMKRMTTVALLGAFTSLL